jgi:hypothetical protein
MAETLQNMVGYQLGITPGANSVPTTTMITQWLKDGSIYVMKHAPLNTVAEKSVTVAATLVGDATLVGAYTLAADFLRFVSWISTLGQPAKLVEPQYGYVVCDAATRGIDSGEVVVWIENAKLLGNTNKDESITGNMKYVKIPADSADVPAKLHDLVVLYAVARAKAEAQEMDEFQALMGELEGKIAKLGEIQ